MRDTKFITSPTNDAPRRTILDTDELAEYLGLKPQTLAKKRLDGSGPVFFKVGRRVVYSLADVHSWLDAQRRTSTSAAA